MIFYLLAGLTSLVLIALLAVRVLGGNFMLVDDWRKAWKFYSTYALAMLALLPDIFNALVAGDYLSGTPVGDQFSAYLKLAAAGTFVLRMIKQVPKPKYSLDDSDKAGT